MTITKTPPFGTQAIGDVDASLRNMAEPDGFDAALQSLDPKTRAMFSRLRQEKKAEATPPPPHEPALHSTSSKTPEEDFPLTPSPGQEDAPEYTDRQGNGLNMAEEKISRDEYRENIIRSADSRDIKTYPSTGITVEHYLKAKPFLNVPGTYNEEVYVVHVPGKRKLAYCMPQSPNYPVTVDEYGNFCTENARNGTRMVWRHDIDDLSTFLPERSYQFGSGVNHGRGCINCRIYPDGKIALTSIKGKVDGYEYFVKTREGGILTIDSNRQLVLADADKLPPELPQQDRTEHLAFTAAVQNGTKSLNDVIQAPDKIAQEEQRLQAERDKVAEIRAKAGKVSFVDKLRKSNSSQRQI